DLVQEIDQRKAGQKKCDGPGAPGVSHALHRRPRTTAHARRLPKQSRTDMALQDFVPTNACNTGERNCEYRMTSTREIYRAAPPNGSGWSSLSRPDDANA